MQNMKKYVENMKTIDSTVAPRASPKSSYAVANSFIVGEMSSQKSLTVDSQSAKNFSENCTAKKQDLEKGPQTFIVIPLSNVSNEFCNVL